MIVSLRGFLESGVFGTVGLGAAQGAVRIALGEPEAIDSFSRPERPSIYKYGDVEMHFDERGQVRLFHIDGFSGDDAVPVGWGDCTLDPWKIKHRTPRSTLERELARAGMSCVLVVKSELRQEWLMTPAGVVLGFVDDPDATGQPPLLEFVSFSMQR